MKKQQLTLKDIARALSVSTSTVSRALKNHPSISEKTKNLITSYAREHNYQANALAANLRTNKNNTIGIILPEIIHHFFSSVLAGIEEVANENNFNIMLCQSKEQYEREVKDTKALITARVAGILASLSKTTTNYDHYQEVLDNDIALVFFDRICIELATDRVVMDDYHGAFEAVTHLIQTGCRRIAFFSGPTHLEISKNRKNGYLDALLKHNIATDPDLIFVCDTREEALVLTPQVLKMPNRPDAFFAINDRTASGILTAVKKENFLVPEDISICGFSNNELALSCDPPLTTVEQNGYEMGREATQLIIDRIKGINPGQYTNKIIRSSLIVRGSTRAL